MSRMPITADELRAMLQQAMAEGSQEPLMRVLELVEERGYLIVRRADVHQLRAAADKVLRHEPER